MTSDGGTPPKRHRRSPRHGVTWTTDEVAEELRRLSATGMTRAAMAKAVGIAESTLYTIFYREIGSRPGKPGRLPHQPTPALRQRVAELRASGLKVDEIAAAIGISAPTLRLHYGPHRGYRS